jgi:hypothetical protein
MSHQPEPRLFQQIFGDMVAAGQAKQEREQPEIEGVVHDIERSLFTAAKLLDERQLGIPVHRSHNARRTPA